MGDEIGVNVDPNGEAKSGKSKKRLSVERIYQKKTQLEHILLRPDTYIGSVQPVTEKVWVLDEESGNIVNREITFVPGLYKIFDEILVNAADNKQRDKKMDTIKIDINPEQNTIKIYNNGKGIPVVQHATEKIYVPTLIFGHLLTSSNFNDGEEKVTGGRNGFGAKLCNVFSTKFTLETASKEYKKEFRQSWGANMSKAGEPKIKDGFHGEDFTRVTFQPDLAKFNMTSLDKDTVSLLSRRAYDVAASTKGVKVVLNGKRIPIKSFKEYVDFFIKGHEDETGNQIKAVHEVCGERWEVALAVSDNGFQQMSFVNSIATTKGGRHVDHVSKLIENSLMEILKKKNKSGVQIKPHQIRNHLWVFVNCLIVNPTFDSQTKEMMTLQQNQFGSKCTFSEKFKKGISSCGVVESVLAWSKFKQDQQLKSKHSAKKTNKLKGVAKLEDANDAGTKNSLDCTLILTEGDSAKTLAVAGLAVVGRDKFGVYPLKGKVLNVREASHKQIMDNKEICDLVKIIGLQYKKKYASVDDLRTLRYGRLMIMTDQDQDGSHIKGLLINFIHHNWPGLLKLPFLEEFITPIVKASKGNNPPMSFFSIPEFTEWKNATNNWHTYKIKYYKGLGTSTSKEAKEYFTDMKRHRIKFHYDGEQDDHAIKLAFAKKEVEQRKDWLTSWMGECKRRKELGLAEIYLYEKNTKSVSFSDFINKELILFSNADNERSIPSLVDGLKPGQRKVVFTCLKRNDKREIKVAQLAGAVGEMSAYHHGENSLMGTIINLAQDFVGSNNLNLLLPIGQFGTRLAGGKDSASPRYIFTQLHPLTRLIFNVHDDNILTYLKDDNKKIEPEFYTPIIPMVLVNGAEGIGTGWSTKVPNYNPREIIKNLLLLLDGKEVSDLQPMVPWFRGFKGTVESIQDQRYVVSGEIAEISDNKVEITELPIRTWTQNYKETVMESYLNGDPPKVQPCIQDYKEYHTDKTVKFVIQMNAGKLRQEEVGKGLHQFFKLQTTIATSSMVLFDRYGALRKFDNVADILKDFFDLRLEYYGKRKAFLEGMLGAESLRLSNQARFIIEKCDGSLVVENKKRKVMVTELQRKNYDPDPVKKWKRTQEKEESDVEGSDSDSDVEDDAKGSDYDYLMGMAMWNLTLEKKEEMLRKKAEKLQELENLRVKTDRDLWRDDLKELLKAMDDFERKEAEEEAEERHKAKMKGGRAGGGIKKFLKQETIPSPHGIRIAPKISEELRKKAAAAAASRKGVKAKKNTVKEEVERDEFDLMIDNKEHNTSLSEKLGFKAEKAPKKEKKEQPKKEKTSKKKGGGKNPWESASGSDIDGDSDSEGGFDLSDFGAPARDKPVRSRAKNVNYNFDKSSSSSGSESDDVDKMKANDGAKEEKTNGVRKKKRRSSVDSDDSDAGGSASKSARPDDESDNDSKFDNLFQKPSENGKKKSAFDDDSESEPEAPPKKKADSDDDYKLQDSDSDGDFNVKAAAKKKGTKTAPKKPSASALAKKKNKFSDSDEESDCVVEPTPPKAAKAAAPKAAKAKPAAKTKTKKLLSTFSDSDEDFGPSAAKKAKSKPAPAKNGGAGGKKKKKALGSDDSSNDEMDFSGIKDYAPAADRPGRQKKTVKYNFGYSDDDSD